MRRKGIIKFQTSYDLYKITECIQFFIMYSFDSYGHGYKE